MEALPNKSRVRAEEILALHLRSLDACCGNALQAVVLTGSLVTGSYTGDAGSDIDLVHILRDDAPDTARADVLACIARTEAQTARDLPIARCVYRLRELLGQIRCGSASAQGGAGICLLCADGGLYPLAVSP